MNATANKTSRPSFVRMLTTSAVKDLVKEAKRVKYAVESTKHEDEKVIFMHKVTDPDYSNALVFKALLVRPGVWATTFSTAYWQDPT